MKKLKKIQFFTARQNADGTVRYYWQPSAGLRRMGWTMKALSADETTAQQEAVRLNAEVEAWRKNSPDAVLSQKPRRAPVMRGSMNALILELKQDRRYQKLAAKTRYEYERNFEFLLSIFGGGQVAQIDRKSIDDLYDALLRTKGVFVANSKLKTLRKLLNYGVRRGYLSSSPMTLFELEKQPHRTSVWTDEAFDAFIETAMKERRSVALAAMLSRWTAQRRGDVLAMKWSDYRNGRIHVTQSKTGVHVEIPVCKIPALEKMLNETPKTSIYIVVSEQTGNPYNKDNFSRVFRKILDRAAQEHPSIDFSGLLLIDFRRTLMTEMGDSECSDSEMRSISGHSGNSRLLHTVYCQNTARQAENGLRKVFEHKYG